MAEVDTKLTKEKKEKKKGKKEKKKEKTVGESVEAINLNKKSSDEYLNNDRFKPVRNPSFNPSLISPLSSPVPSATQALAANNKNNRDEKWIISSTLKENGRVNNEKSGSTPAELQGSAVQKHIPNDGHGRPDPTEPENAHSAFKRLQQLVMTGQPKQQQQQQQQQTQRPLGTDASNRNDRPNRLPDGAPIVQYVRALWNYTAQVNAQSCHTTLY